jgi:hypothetical protein
LLVVVLVPVVEVVLPPLFVVEVVPPLLLLTVVPSELVPPPPPPQPAMRSDKARVSAIIAAKFIFLPIAALFEQFLFKNFRSPATCMIPSDNKISSRLRVSKRPPLKEPLFYIIVL